MVVRGTFPFAREVQLYRRWVPGACADLTALDCTAGGDKVFTGRRVSAEDFAAALAPARYDPDARVVIAAPRAVGREWRLRVAGGRVAAASQYADAGV